MKKIISIASLLLAAALSAQTQAAANPAGAPKGGTSSRRIGYYKK